MGVVLMRFICGLIPISMIRSPGFADKFDDYAILCFISILMFTTVGGVEEAFYTTDRVMTLSIHKFGDFFPGTVHIRDIGNLGGKYYALSVPLNNGINDDHFCSLFRPIIQKVMEVYQPDVVVFQRGPDSLAGDRLGCFNLSVKGHADCLRFLRSFNVPPMVLGGGGYTIRYVAGCWCYETAVSVDVEPDNKLPYNEYYEYLAHITLCMWNQVIWKILILTKILRKLGEDWHQTPFLFVHLLRSPVNR